MEQNCRYLIVDGYPEPSREELARAGMTLAWKLYRQMLEVYRPDAACDIWLAADEAPPDNVQLAQYTGVLWTGCNQSVNDLGNDSVVQQIDVAKRSFELGVPGFGSCWALQIAVVAAGGEVKPNPLGREMGVARKIVLTEEGRRHQFYEGRGEVFDAFSSHDDIVTRAPKNCQVLAKNWFSPVQAAVIEHLNGSFFGLQYHPEYTLHEIARLIVAREQKLLDRNFFADAKALHTYVDQLEALAAEPSRFDLRWQLGIDDDLLDDRTRQREFSSWLTKHRE